MAKTRIWGLGNPEEEAKGVMAVMCPGCKCHHIIATVQPFSNGATWKFNGDLEKPTFSPSLLVKTGSYACPGFVDPPGIPGVVCHSWIESGTIRFMDDCTHDLRNQAVELPDVDHRWPDEPAE